LKHPVQHAANRLS